MLEGIVRESIGKPEIKKLRRNGYLIANIYGKGLENIHAAFLTSEFIRAVKSKSGIAFDVNVAGQEMKVVVKEYQSHPVTDQLLHVDLMVAQPGVVTTYHIPVVAVGTPVGLKNKGVLIASKKRVRLKGAIEDMPEKIEVDVSNLDVGDATLVRDITVPANVKVMDAERVALLGVIKAK